MAGTHRNWSMGHDSQTFQNSYMADRYPGDLLKLAFGQEEGNTDEVFAMFNNTSNECDPGAPLFLSTAQELEYNQRRTPTESPDQHPFGPPTVYPGLRRSGRAQATGAATAYIQLTS